MKTFKVSIITPHEKLFEREANSLYMRSEIGYLEVLADHTPLLANTVAGKVIVKSQGSKIGFLSTGNGFLEVLNNNITILLEEAKVLDNL